MDKERYSRVRQSVVSGDTIVKPKESKPSRKIRPLHPTKDTLPDKANLRTWIGPWEMFSEDQQESVIGAFSSLNKEKEKKSAKQSKEISRIFLLFFARKTSPLSDLERKHPEIKNARQRLPELIYNNVEEVHEYIRMLPYIPHTFFKPGTCAPDAYKKNTAKWSKRKLRRAMRLGDGKRAVEERVLEQLDMRKQTFPRFLHHPIDPNHYWPRLTPGIDPKYKEKYHELYGEGVGEDNLEDEEFSDWGEGEGKDEKKVV